jgi:hypothetical protein
LYFFSGAIADDFRMVEDWALANIATGIFSVSGGLAMLVFPSQIDG